MALPLGADRLETAYFICLYGMALKPKRVIPIRLAMTIHGLLFLKHEFYRQLVSSSFDK